MTAYSGNTGSTVSDMKKSPKSSKKLETIQFAQLWAGLNNDYKILRNILTKCSKKQTTYRFNSWEQQEL